MVGNEVLFLDFSFALHHGLLKYNKVVAFYMTCLQMVWVAIHYVAIVVVDIHGNVTFVPIFVHRRRFAPNDAALIISCVPGKNQTKSDF